jgi:hypothetical protein
VAEHDGRGSAIALSPRSDRENKRGHSIHRKEDEMKKFHVCAMVVVADVVYGCLRAALTRRRHGLGVVAAAATADRTPDHGDMRLTPVHGRSLAPP